MCVLRYFNNYKIIVLLNHIKNDHNQNLENSKENVPVEQSHVCLFILINIQRKEFKRFVCMLQHFH